jgi:hypothetical protein
MDELQALYDSEINFTISTFWDVGFTWKLGDDMNGFVADGEAKTMQQAGAELVSAAIARISGIRVCTQKVSGMAKKHFIHIQFAVGRPTRDSDFSL